MLPVHFEVPLMHQVSYWHACVLGKEQQGIIVRQGSRCFHDSVCSLVGQLLLIRSDASLLNSTLHLAHALLHNVPQLLPVLMPGQRFGNPLWVIFPTGVAGMAGLVTGMKGHPTRAAS